MKKLKYFTQVYIKAFICLLLVIFAQYINSQELNQGQTFTGSVTGSLNNTHVLATDVLGNITKATSIVIGEGRKSKYHVNSAHR